VGRNNSPPPDLKRKRKLRFTAVSSSGSFCDALSYQDFNDTQFRAGSVDFVLGQCSKGERTIISPFELKGAKTQNLEAIMPGPAKARRSSQGAKPRFFLARPVLPT
jgi:hypothetical protein